MEVTPGPAKRAKRKDSPAQPTGKPVTVAKKTRVSRKAAAPTIPERSEITIAVPSPPMAEDMNGMIATAAYFLAAERHFHPGHELDDWLEAERRIRAAYYG